MKEKYEVPELEIISLNLGSIIAMSSGGETDPPVVKDNDNIGNIEDTDW